MRAGDARGAGAAPVSSNDRRRRLLGLVRPYVGRVAVTIAATLAASLLQGIGLMLLIPFLRALLEPQASAAAVGGAHPSRVEMLLQQIVGPLIAHDRPETALYKVVVVLLGVLVLKSALEFVAQMATVSIQEGVARDLRILVFRHLQTLPLAYFQKTRAGQTQTRVHHDINQVRTAVNAVLVSLLHNVLVIAAGLFILFALSARLTLLTAVAGGIVAVITRPFASPLRRRWRQIAAEGGEMSSRVGETVGAMKLVRAYAAEAFEVARFTRIAELHRRGLIRLQRLSSLARVVNEMFGGLMVVGILWFGVRLALRDPAALRPEELITFLIVSLQLMTPVKALAGYPATMAGALAASDRVAEVLDLPLAEIDAPDAGEAVFRDRIEYRRVSFGYGDGPSVLRDVSFELRRGQVVAVVGPSGAGKTTLAELLARFYEPTAGEILLDGVPITRSTRRSLRALMGIVAQDTILLNDTALENIAYGHLDFSREQVRAAARIANAHDFIMGLPRGYDTPLGERGTKISGGERQRIAIARAVLRDPPILVLDEATNQLDGESERLVQAAIDRLMRDRTVLVIAHRLTTVQHADLILVLSEGRIIERGTHDTLLAAGGLYARLYELQFRTESV